VGVETTIALRYLRAKRRNSLLSLISFLAVGGIGLGVAALIVVLAVLDGFETNLKEKLLGLQPHVTIYNVGDNIYDWREITRRVRATPGVVTAQPAITGQVMISSGQGTAGVLLKGISPELAAEGDYFGPMGLSPYGLENLTLRPMRSPYPPPSDGLGQIFDLNDIGGYAAPEGAELGWEDAPGAPGLQPEEGFDPASEEDLGPIDLSPLSWRDDFAEEDLMAPGDAGAGLNLGPGAGVEEAGADGAGGAAEPPPGNGAVAAEEPMAGDGRAESEADAQGGAEGAIAPEGESAEGESAAEGDEDYLEFPPPEGFTVAAEEEPLYVADPEGYLNGLPGIIVGRELSLLLGQMALGEASVISPFGRVTPIGRRAPLTRSYRIAGVFRTNYYEFDSKIVFTTIAEAQSLLGMDDSVSQIEVWVDDIYRAGEIRRAIVSELGPFSYAGEDWIQMNVSLFSALKLEQTAMFVILTLIILVAAFNIASTLVMMVTEKTRDIAILKAMGASSRQIRRIFTVQGLIVGAVGTAGGLVIGVTLCALLKRYEFIKLPPEVYLMSTLPVEMRPAQILAIVLVSLLISYLATLYPSSQAAKLDPVEAIRYE
jgi:lipoprotein-releasing system permease protein